MLRSFILVILLVFSQCSYGQNKEWTEDQWLLAGILAGEMLLGLSSSGKKISV